MLHKMSFMCCAYFDPKKYILKQKWTVFHNYVNQLLVQTLNTMYKKSNLVFILSMKMWKNTLKSRIL